MKNDFTIGILTNNDARSIARTLTSSLNITNNIVILDTGSSDKTLDIISDFKKEFPGIRLFKTPWNNNFSDARNKLISHTITQWLLMIDADEFLDINQEKEILDMLNNISVSTINDISVYSVSIQDSDGHITNNHHRIMNVSANVQFSGLIHEQLLENNVPIMFAPEAGIILKHDGYTPEILSTKNKAQRNIELLKKMIILDPDNARWYYFLTRDCISSNSFDEKEITMLIETGLQKANAVDYEVGLILNLIKVNLTNKNLISPYIMQLKNKYPILVDSYYYESLLNYSELLENLDEHTNNLIKNIANLSSTQSLVDSNLSHIFDLIGWNKFISGDLESSMSMYGHVKNPIYLESRIDQLKNLLNTLEEQKNEAFKNTVY